MVGRWQGVLRVDVGGGGRKGGCAMGRGRIRLCENRGG